MSLSICIKGKDSKMHFLGAELLKRKPTKGSHSAEHRSCRCVTAQPSERSETLVLPEAREAHPLQRWANAWQGAIQEEQKPCEPASSCRRRTRRVQQCIQVVASSAKLASSRFMTVAVMENRCPWASPRCKPEVLGTHSKRCPSKCKQGLSIAAAHRQMRQQSTAWQTARKT